MEWRRDRMRRDWMRRGRQNGEVIPFCCSALQKIRTSNASEDRLSNRTERHAIRLCRRLNTCLFLSSKMTKNPRESTEA